MFFKTKSKSDSKRRNPAGQPRNSNRRAGASACAVEPLEDRLLMAIASATGGSGFSGTLARNPTIRRQQLICDPAGPRRGSTSVTYDPTQVSLAAYQYGPGYGPLPAGTTNRVGYVGVMGAGGVPVLQPIPAFLDTPPQSRPAQTGYVQMNYWLYGTAGQIAPADGYTILDEAGVDGVDTHALLFDDVVQGPGAPEAGDGVGSAPAPAANLSGMSFNMALLPIVAGQRPDFAVIAAPVDFHAKNAADFMEVDDGSGKILGPADIAPAFVYEVPQHGSFSGTAFHDTDFDGVLDAGEPPIAGATVYVDLDHDKTFDATEPTKTTDAQGYYLFDKVPPGSYDVREVTQAGFLPALTTPASGVHTVTVVAGRRVRDLNFGSVRAAGATGMVFNDANGDGVRQRTEAGVGGVVVYADLNRNGVLDRGEPSDSSDPAGILTPAGTWAIAGLRPGNYVFREIRPAGQVQTAPASGFHNVALTSGSSARGLNFGNRAATAPRVGGVFISGPSWNATFKNYLAANGLGDATLGYRIDPASVRRDIPWADATQVSIRFDQPVNVDMADLAVQSLRGERTYSFRDFAYNTATRTATWTLTRPIAAERMAMTLDADAGGVTGADGMPLDGAWPGDGLITEGPFPTYPAGDGTPGGDFRLGAPVLIGNTTGDGAVNALDLADIRRRLNRSTTDTAVLTTVEAAYSIFADVNPDGRINALDIAATRRMLGNRLPSVVLVPIDPRPIPIDPIPIVINPRPLPLPLAPSAADLITADVFSDAPALT